MYEIIGGKSQHRAVESGLILKDLQCYLQTSKKALVTRLLYNPTVINANFCERREAKSHEFVS